MPGEESYVHAGSTGLIVDFVGSAFFERGTMVHPLTSHKMAEQLYDEVSEIVKDGAEKEPCDPETLDRFNALARSVIPHDIIDKYVFNSRVQFSDSKQSYGVVLDRTWKLCAITLEQVASLDDRAVDQEPRDQACDTGTVRSRTRRWLVPVLTTITAGGIVYVVAAHFAVVAPQTLRWFFGQ